MLSIILVLIGIIGLTFTWNNLIQLLISIEIILLGINLHFILSSLLLDDSFGIITSLLILTIAAAETTIGLSILILVFKQYKTANFEKIYNLNG